MKIIKPPLHPLWTKIWTFFVRYKKIVENYIICRKCYITCIGTLDLIIFAWNSRGGTISKVFGKFWTLINFMKTNFNFESKEILCLWQGNFWSLVSDFEMTKLMCAYSTFLQGNSRKCSIKACLLFIIYNKFPCSRIPTSYIFSEIENHSLWIYVIGFSMERYALSKF